MAQWTPPDFARPPDSFSPRKRSIEEELEDEFAQQEPEQSYLSKFWDYINTPLTRKPSELVSGPAESLMQYGEREGSNLARYGGAYLQSLGDVASSLTNPLNLALTATTYGSLGAAGAAARTGNIANKQALQRIAQALEAPGRAAGVGMVGHGTYKAVSEPETSDKIGGVAEALLGAVGARRITPETTKVDVLDAPPVNRGMFPLPRGRSEVVEHEPFIAGPSSLMEMGKPTPNRPITFSEIENRPNLDEIARRLSSDQPPIIDDQGGMDWIPEEVQPPPVDNAKLQTFLTETKKK